LRGRSQPLSEACPALSFYDRNTFVKFYLKNGDRLAEKAGYIPLPTEGYQLAENYFYQGKVGTVFRVNFNRVSRFLNC
jgi:hypothetical protein